MPLSENDNSRMVQAIHRNSDLDWVRDSSLLFQTVWAQYLQQEVERKNLPPETIQEIEDEIVELFIQKFKYGNPQSLLIVLCKNRVRRVREMDRAETKTKMRQEFELENLFSGVL